MEGRTFWITGLSGAGKTTIGRLWYEELRASGVPAVFLDGDRLRQAIGDDLGYSEADRRKSARRNGKLCALLAEQGLTVVCCTICMYDEARLWNRENIPGYFEVYVKAAMETLRRRDQKGLYSQNADNVAGVGLQVELPKAPDLVLNNNGQLTPQEQVARLRTAAFGTED